MYVRVAFVFHFFFVFGYMTKYSSPDSMEAIQTIVLDLLKQHIDEDVLATLMPVPIYTCV